MNSVTKLNSKINSNTPRRIQNKTLNYCFQLPTPCVYLCIHSLIRWDWRTSANQVAITIYIINTTDTGPELMIRCHPRCRKGGSLARIRFGPFIAIHHVHCVRSSFQWGVSNSNNTCKLHVYTKKCWSSHWKCVFKHKIYNRSMHEQGKGGRLVAPHRTQISCNTPVMTSSISLRILNMASQNLSNSALSSDSVGSTIRVPTTGQDMVGEWKP